MDNPLSNKPQHNLTTLIRNFVIELILYGLLVIGYFLLVLRYLNNFLAYLFENSSVVYAVLALILIVIQGVFLDGLTSFLLQKIKLERLE